MHMFNHHMTGRDKIKSKQLVMCQSNLLYNIQSNDMHIFYFISKNSTDSKHCNKHHKFLINYPLNYTKANQCHHSV